MAQLHAWYIVNVENVLISLLSKITKKEKMLYLPTLKLQFYMWGALKEYPDKNVNLRLNYAQPSNWKGQVPWHSVTMTDSPRPTFWWVNWEKFMRIRIRKTVNPMKFGNRCLIPGPHDQGIWGVNDVLDLGGLWSCWGHAVSWNSNSNLQKDGNQILSFKKY